MGIRDSKPCFITYEEAVKRVSDAELRRIREAFKRCSGANGSTLSLDAFIHDVLCDCVPSEVSEWLYQACGGTKRGIAFKELLCGLVVLTKGTVDEKIRLLWALYVNNQSDSSGGHIYKWDIARALHLENTCLPSNSAVRTTELLTGLFGTNDKVAFEQFRWWILTHKDATLLSRWLLCTDTVSLTSDLETPTFYQTLAGVTHLDERDIIELEKCFWTLRSRAPSGQLDLTSLSPLLCPPLPSSAVEGTFKAFDENLDGHIDFKELCCGLSAACRGPRIERLKFCFKIFDKDRDGMLNSQEVLDMIKILTDVANESLKNQQNSRSSTPNDSHENESQERLFDVDIVLENLREKLSNSSKPAEVKFKLGGDEKRPSRLTRLLENKPNSKSDSKLDVGDSKLDASDSKLDASDSKLETGDSKRDKGDSKLNTSDSKLVASLKPNMGESSSEDDYSNGEVFESSVTMSQEDFLIWSVENVESLVNPFLDLVFEVCHIVLGLRPHCKHQERDIVLGWLWREVQRGYSVGQFWYLISSDWWSNWLSYTQSVNPSAQGESCCRAIPMRQVDEAIVCDESFTSNSTESMGSLLVETASVGSASSSGVSSTAPVPHPGPIANQKLLAPQLYKVRSLTGEGGHLRRDVTLAQHRDFELVPDAVWKALAHWYGGPHPLPRQVIRPPNSDVELELYPLHIRLYGHAQNTQPALPWSLPTERRLAYTAAFSRLANIRQVTEFLCGALRLARENVRLWSLGPSPSPTASSAPTLLDDDLLVLEELDEKPRLLLEVRNADQTWPEEIGALSPWGSDNGVGARRGTAPALAGATGLHNLGNTCFMNAALQAVWNTSPLTTYFNSGMHLHEVNTENPLGTRGALAIRYGELCKEVWSSKVRSVAPLRVRALVSHYAPALAPGAQHDAQELLAWLLDALHEDLNRAVPGQKGKPLTGQETASEAWEQHKLRNNSIITDLFYGQLRSKVICDACGHESVTFDAFNMLSLPLPMEAYLHCEIRVILLDGSVPVKYGLRINSESTNLELKKALSELCELPSSRMLLVELAGSWISRVYEDDSKARAPISGEYYVYELPEDRYYDYEDTESDARWWRRASLAPPAPPPPPPAPPLCIPAALFCFKRSRTEMLMSVSPPHIFTPKPDESITEQSQVKGNNSPTLSVKSLNLKVESPKLRRVTFGSSPSNMNNLDAGSRDSASVGTAKFLVALHRKQIRQETYFLSAHKWRGAVFGCPVLVALYEGASGASLHRAVHAQVSRLLAPRPKRSTHNHAADCDDSLGYAYPFTLRVVRSGGLWCAVCPWTSFCTGCTVPCTEKPFIRNLSRGVSSNNNSLNSQMSSEETLRPSTKDYDSSSNVYIEDGYTPTEKELQCLDFDVIRAIYSRLSRGNNNTSNACVIPPVMLAIDWDPTALHLRYQSCREKSFTEHESVEACRTAASKAVGLETCLETFTAEEKLEQPYSCDRCKQAQPATKKLQIWRLPPIMIIHLKRFQYVNNKWIKSQKVVKFPLEDFDPTEYLAAVPQETIHRHRELETRRSEGDSSSGEEGSDLEQDKDRSLDTQSSKPAPTRRVNKRKRLQSSSLQSAPVKDDALEDYHRHALTEGHDPLHLNYRLYAVISHSGQLSGGHYVAYARNPSGAWLCYNDSSCRLLPAPPAIDPSAAYLLFYERVGLKADAYVPPIPDTPPKPPEIVDIDNPNNCVLA